MAKLEFIHNPNKDKHYFCAFCQKFHPEGYMHNWSSGTITYSSNAEWRIMGVTTDTITVERR